VEICARNSPLARAKDVPDDHERCDQEQAHDQAVPDPFIAVIMRAP
jgi:hypothetical protein